MVRSHRWLAAVVALSFAGTWWLVAYGQNTGFMLLGLAGFLHFRRADRPLAAGACAALTALKPHLLACFGVLLVANIAHAPRVGDTRDRRRRDSRSHSAVAVTANPAVVAQFVETARHPAEGATPLSAWALPVPAYWLRMWLAPDQFWVQFVPCASRAAASLRAVFGAGRDWDWSRELPLVVAVSVLATPYGGWIFDLPVLLVPVVYAAVARLVSVKQWAARGRVVVGQAAITVASFARPGGLHEYWWVAPRGAVSADQANPER